MWWLAIIVLAVYLINRWLGRDSTRRRVAYSCSFVTPCVGTRRDLINGYFVDLSTFPFSVLSHEQFRTILERGRHMRRGEKYFYGNLKTVVTLLHRPTSGGMIQWSILHEFDLERPSDDKHVKRIAQEASRGFHAYITTLAQQRRSLSA